ncbi:hypothetical protein JCM8208_007688 [Rhodotorula glutinis]
MEPAHSPHGPEMGARRAPEYPGLHNAPRQLPPGAAYAPQHAPVVAAPPPPPPPRLVESPVNYSRPLSVSPAPPPPQQHSNSAPPALHTRRSFIGPSHLASPSSSSSPSPSAAAAGAPSTRTAAASGMHLASQLPSFVPAVAFSPEDRGPYPPLASPTREVREPNHAVADYLDAATASSSATPAPALARPRSLAALNEPSSSSAARDLDMAGVGTRASLILPSTSTASTSTTPVLLSPPRTGAPTPARSPQLVAASPYASAPAASAALVSPSPAGVGAPPPPLSSAPSPSAYAAPPGAPPPPKPPQPPPPHLVPQPEVCVECMMRDRDMADVDVTGARVWERDSDAEWDEQVRWEADQQHVEQLGGPGSYEAHGAGGSSESGGALGGAGGVRRSVYERESSSAHTGGGAGPGGRRRVGKGQLLTSGNLKVWTTMNPPAAAHRWRTLQTFLATQAHYLELDRQARIREASAAASASLSSSSPHGPSPIELLPAAAAAGQPRNRASSLLSPESLAAEKAALEHEERVALRATKSRSRATLADETNLHQHHQQQSFRHSSASLLPPPSLYNGAAGGGNGAGGGGNASSGSSMRSYSAGDQPWLGPALRRLSSPSAAAPAPGPGGAGASQLSASPPKSPATSMASSRFAFPKFARSSTDLRSLPPGGTGGGGATPRSVSPARTSGDGSARRPTSMWSRFRQSASAASVLSFAPSGSMMDMHLGLEQDQRAGLAAAGGPGYGSLGHYGGGGGGAAMYAAQHGAGGGVGAGAGAGYGFGSPQQAVYDAYGAAAMSDPAVARHADRRERERVLAETAAAREAAAAAAAAEAEHGAGKKKKKGLKGFFNKLVGGGGGSGSSGGRARSRTLGSSSAPATPGVDRGAPFDASLGPGSRYGGAGAGDDDELAPPPPLSALANEPRYHLRSGSSSSVDSLGPYTPPLPPQQQFRQSYHMPMPGGPHAADRQSILTLGSFTSTRSNGGGGGGGGNKPAGGAGARASTVPSRNSWVGRPSLDSVRRPGSFGGGPALGGGPGDAEPEVLAGGVDDLDFDPEQQQHDDDHELLHPPLHPRSQKSLPLLPSEATYRGSPSPYYPYHAARAGPPAGYDAPTASAGPYANYGASRSAYTLGSSPAADSRTSLAQEFGLVGGDRDREHEQQQHTVRKSRSRHKVFSLSFGSNSGKKSHHRQSSAEVGQSPPPPPLPSAARGASLDSSSVMRYAEAYDGRPPVEALVGGMR